MCYQLLTGISQDHLAPLPGNTWWRIRWRKSRCSQRTLSVPIYGQKEFWQHSVGFFSSVPADEPIANSGCFRAATPPRGTAASSTIRILFTAAVRRKLFLTIGALPTAAILVFPSAAAPLQSRRRGLLLGDICFSLERCSRDSLRASDERA